MSELHDLEKAIEHEISNAAHFVRDRDHEKNHDCTAEELRSNEEHGEREQSEADMKRECEDKGKEPSKLDALKKAFTAARVAGAVALHRAHSAGHHAKELFEHLR